jgi:hypothetical protein
MYLDGICGHRQTAEPSHVGNEQSTTIMAIASLFWIF